MIQRLKTFAGALLYLALAVVIMIFAVNNRDDVAFSLYPLPYEIVLPKYFFLLIIFILGLIVGATINGKRFLARRRQYRKAEAHIAALENELAGLKAEKSSQQALPSTLP